MPLGGAHRPLGVHTEIIDTKNTSVVLRSTEGQKVVRLSYAVADWSKNKIHEIKDAMWVILKGSLSVAGCGDGAKPGEGSLVKGGLSGFCVYKESR